MPKVDIDLVKLKAQQEIPDVRMVAALMRALEEELKAEEEEKANKPPPLKKQFVILIADQNGVLQNMDLTGWVLQIPEEDSVTVAAERIIKAAYEFNTTPKGRKMPIESIGEACECVTAKFFKEQQIWIKTKIPVLVTTTENKIPTERAE